MNAQAEGAGGRIVGGAGALERDQGGLGFEFGLILNHEHASFGGAER